MRTLLGLLLLCSSHALQLQRSAGPPRSAQLLRLRGGGAVAPPLQFQAADAIGFTSAVGFTTGFIIGKLVNEATNGATTVGKLVAGQCASAVVIIAAAEKIGAITINWERLKPTINCVLREANAACKRVGLGSTVDKLAEKVKNIKCFSGMFEWLDGKKDGKSTKAVPKDPKLLARRNRFANVGALVGISLGLQKGMAN